YFADHIRKADELAWDERSETVIARRATRLDDLLIEEKPLQDVPREASAAAMLDGVRRLGLDALPWDDDARDYLARIELLRRQPRPEFAEFPGSSVAALGDDLAWLEPFLAGATRRAHLARIPLLDALRARLTYAQQRVLDEQMPTHVTLPTG